ncbi:hypothetical protein ROG8370_03727 [Roseovarius gaetbuli]|uniref:Uncharacterized protein n=1 Tax=Roseovarius gaetbuli TaxID=1356575 RepID=A0A1X7AB98_9RHOB|nr:hypothetical protein [Roseovarius gaetbuli]SLN75012.1 hypothetical protein ROG8370_03727 [Roseovarius gaetbuli]
MKVGRIINAIKGVGTFPALLVLLLALRVVAAPAIECQHELAAKAAQAKTAAHAQHMDGGQVPSDKHHLYTPCPFFTAARVLPDCGAEPDATNLVYSRTRVQSDDFRVAAGALPAAYSPRAPLGSALG